MKPIICGVIPGRREAASPESITTGRGLWIPGSPPSVAPRNDAAYDSNFEVAGLAGPMPRHGNGAATQGQRLIFQHPLDDDLAGGLGIEAMLSHEIAAVRNDGVGILHHFEMLVRILAIDSHAFAHDVQEIDNAERPVAFVGAKFAM